MMEKVMHLSYHHQNLEYVLTCNVCRINCRYVGSKGRRKGRILPWSSRSSPTRKSFFSFSGTVSVHPTGLPHHTRTFTASRLPSATSSQPCQQPKRYTKKIPYDIFSSICPKFCQTHGFSCRHKFRCGYYRPRSSCSYSIHGFNFAITASLFCRSDDRQQGTWESSDRGRCTCRTAWHVIQDNRWAWAAEETPAVVMEAPVQDRCQAHDHQLPTAYAPVPDIVETSVTCRLCINRIRWPSATRDHAVSEPTHSLLENYCVDHQTWISVATLSLTGLIHFICFFVF